MDIRGKRFLVVGGAGLIGSHTADLLTKEDVGELVVYDNFARGTQENLTDALRDPRVKIYETGGDICQTDILNDDCNGRTVCFTSPHSGGIAPGTISAWAQYTLRLERRDAVAARLKEHNVPTAVYYPKPLHQQTAYTRFPAAPGGLPRVGAPGARGLEFADAPLSGMGNTGLHHRCRACCGKECISTLLDFPLCISAGH